MFLNNNIFLAGSDIGLKFVQLDVPGALHSGESTWLKCLYELGTDELYSVKWYKNNVEFFRYLPSDNPAGQNYELLGVFVNVSLCIFYEIVLQFFISCALKNGNKRLNRF